MDNQKKEIETRHSLYSAGLVSDHIGDDMVIFRAPTILDGSGYHKRLPEEVKFEHIQVGDSLIIVSIYARPSGMRTLELLRFVDVVGVSEYGDEYEVFINDIVPPGSTGKQVFDRMADMLGKPHSDHDPATDIY